VRGFAADDEETGDEMNWRERASLLESMIETARSQVGEAQREVEGARAELASVQTASDLMREEIVRRRGVAKAVTSTSPSAPGSGMNIEALEAQLLAVKVAFAEAKFEKESLEAEASALRDRLATALPPELHLLEHAGIDLGEEDTTDLSCNRRSDVIMVTSSNSEYRSGVLFLDGGKLVFEPDHIGDEADSGAQEKQVWDLNKGGFEVSVVSPEVSTSVQDASAIHATVRRLKVRRGSHLNALEFVGFRGAIDHIHARLAAEVKLVPPSVGPSPEPVILRPASESAVPSFFSLPAGTLSSESRDSGAARGRYSGFGASLVERISQSIQGPQAPLSLFRKTSALGSRPLSESTSFDDGTTETCDSNTSRDSAVGTTFRFRLSQSSQIVAEEQFMQLLEQIPGRYHERDFTLRYSTMEHGISLQTFYARVGRHSPMIILIRDSKKSVFGGFSSVPWRPEKSYYGTGESFVFRLGDQKGVFKWTRANNYFQLSSTDFIAMGGGGHYAFRLDSEFLCGTSGPCDTFGSPCLSASEEFTCVALEAWSLDTRRSARAVAHSN